MGDGSCGMYPSTRRPISPFPFFFFLFFLNKKHACSVGTLQFFFAAVGAGGDASSIFGEAFRYLVYSALQIFLHLAFSLSAALLCNWVFAKLRPRRSDDGALLPRKIILLASNASVGGPSTAAGLAATMGWKSLIAPAVLVGVLGERDDKSTCVVNMILIKETAIYVYVTAGYAIGTFASIALGYGVLRHIPIWY